MNRAVILLGTNTGDLLRNLEQALAFMGRSIGAITLKSYVYETEPWGLKEQPSFYNQVIEISTSLEARPLMDELLEIEKAMGRERVAKWEPRIIDLDILYFNDAIIQERDLIIPHPRLHDRRFTLKPLTEILPDDIHPLFKKSNHQLLTELKDDLKVQIVKTENAVISHADQTGIKR